MNFSFFILFQSLKTQIQPWSEGKNIHSTHDLNTVSATIVDVSKKQWKSLSTLPSISRPQTQISWASLNENSFTVNCVIAWILEHLSL